MAKRNLSDDMANMTADEILRATGQAAPVDLVGDLSDPVPESPKPEPETPKTDAYTPRRAVVDDGSTVARLEQMVGVLVEAIAKREAGAPSAENSVALDRLTVALERMANAQDKNAREALEESRRAFRPSNNVIPGVSVYNRRGTKLEDYQKPQLKCLMMIPWMLEWATLTREEVELLNLLEQGEYEVRRADRSRVKLKVLIDYKLDRVTPTSLKVVHESAWSQDNFRLMPSLSDMLRDMLKQHDRVIAQKAALVLSDEEEEVLIEAGSLSVSV
jgi:hypothetical protein